MEAHQTLASQVQLWKDPIKQKLLLYKIKKKGEEWQFWLQLALGKKKVCEHLSLYTQEMQIKIRLFLLIPCEQTIVLANAFWSFLFFKSKYMEK